jgi:hypothetical protein
LCTRAGQAQAAGQAFGCVAQAISQLLGCQLQASEQRQVAPLLQEGLQADVVHALGERVVGFAPFGAFPGIVDAGVGTDDHQRGDEVRVHQRQVQAGSAAEAVADEGAGAAHRGQHVGRAPQVGAHVCRAAVTGEVDHGGQEALLGEVLRDRLPRVAGLGEAVHERDARCLTVAELLCGQGAGMWTPVRHRTTRRRSCRR